MIRTLAIIVIGLVLCFGFVGCKGKSGEPNDMAVYQGQAEKEIDATNMDAELDKIEKEMAEEEANGL